MSSRMLSFALLICLTFGLHRSHQIQQKQQKQHQQHHLIHNAKHHSFNNHNHNHSHKQKNEFEELKGLDFMKLDQAAEETSTTYEGKKIFIGITRSNDLLSNKWIVLISGVMEYTFRWKFMRGELKAEGYNVIEYDHIGRGRSDRLDPSTTLNLEYYCGELQAVLKAAGVQSTNDLTVLGHSMGGAIAISCSSGLSTAGLNVKSVIALAPAGFFTKVVIWLAKVAYKVHSGLPQSMMAQFRRDQEVEYRKDFCKLATPDPHLLFKQNRDAMEAMYEYNNEIHLALGKSILEFNELTDAKPGLRLLRDSHVPLLIIIGSEDVTCPTKESTGALCPILNSKSKPYSEAKFYYVPETRHLLHWEKPTQVHNAIKAFLNNQEITLPGACDSSKPKTGASIPEDICDDFNKVLPNYEKS